MHNVGEGQQDGYGGQGPQAWQNSDQISDYDAENRPHQIMQFKRNTEPIPEVKQ
jgi:hypothetical protein